MTLTEYLNQADPVRMPNVFLTENEYIKHNTIQIGRDKLTSITIPAIWEHFKVNGAYVQKNDSTALYSQDEHGNTKSLSCFILPQTIIN
jgi:DUF438 domain-containing protein